MATTLASQSDSYSKAASQSNHADVSLALAISEPSPGLLMVTGAISLVLLAIFLRHKLG
jgi:hypothetical protein